jgi:hypothetical protein
MTFILMPKFLFYWKDFLCPSGIRHHVRMGVKLSILQTCWSHPPAQLQSPGMKGTNLMKAQHFIFCHFFPIPQGLLGLNKGFRPTFSQTTLTDKQFDAHVYMVWWHQIVDPFLESIRPWKSLNFCENVQLYEAETLHFWNQHHQSIPKHLFSVDPYDCQTKVHNLALIPWSKTMRGTSRAFSF